MNSIIEELRAELIRNADEKVKKTGERFFRESVEMYGLRSATVSRIGKEYYKSLQNINKSEIFSLCEGLWKSGIMEESFIACSWSYNMRKKYEPDDFKIFEKWVKQYITNWASCDTFCNHTIGTFIEMYPQYLNELKNWAISENRWVRRAAAVSLIVPARKGKFLNEIFEIADILHSDSDDMVQKGYGWMLKVACKNHQDEVFSYVMKRKSTMPRTSLRYAIEKMPPRLKAEAMAK